MAEATTTTSVDGPASKQIPAEHSETSALFTALKQREEAVAIREADVERRVEAVSIAEAQISEQLQKLVAAEERLRATIALADEASETDLTRLTTVYENMKPKEASALFEEMEPQFAAGFLGLMRPDAAAAIMAGLSPEKAYEISVLFAGRNANVPTD